MRTKKSYKAGLRKKQLEIAQARRTDDGELISQGTDQPSSVPVAGPSGSVSSRSGPGPSDPALGLSYDGLGTLDRGPGSTDQSEGSTCSSRRSSRLSVKSYSSKNEKAMAMAASNVPHEFVRPRPLVVHHGSKLPPGLARGGLSVSEQRSKLRRRSLG